MAARDALAQHIAEACGFTTACPVHIQLANDALRDVLNALPSAESVFQAIKHGDEKHQAWLRGALEAIWEGRLPPPVT